MHEDVLPVTDCTQELLIIALVQLALNPNWPEDELACNVTGM
jgi:hypothetical protein